MLAADCNLERIMAICQGRETMFTPIVNNMMRKSTLLQLLSCNFFTKE